MEPDHFESSLFYHSLNYRTFVQLDFRWFPIMAVLYFDCNSGVVMWSWKEANTAFVYLAILTGNWVHLFLFHWILLFLLISLDLICSFILILKKDICYVFNIQFKMFSNFCFFLNYKLFRHINIQTFGHF